MPRKTSFKVFGLMDFHFLKYKVNSKYEDVEEYQTRFLRHNSRGVDASNYSRMVNMVNNKSINLKV